MFVNVDDAVKIFVFNFPFKLWFQIYLHVYCDFCFLVLFSLWLVL